MLEAGASVNIYMFFGGTNFGFTAGIFFKKNTKCKLQLSNYQISGANGPLVGGYRGEYTADITSYDYGNLLSYFAKIVSIFNTKLIKRCGNG